jgi:sulfofructose kinase
MKLPLPLPPREAKTFDAVGVGLNSLDLLAVVPQHPAPNSKHRLVEFARLPGGEAATAMVACARQGWRARYVGVLGSDDHGRLVEDALRREGVDLSATRRAEAPNQMAVILVDGQAGTRTVLWRRDPGLVMSAAAVDPSVAASGRVLMVDAHNTDAAVAATRAARAAGVPTLLDTERLHAGIEALLPWIDILAVAEPFPAALTGAASVGEGLRRLAHEFRPALAVVTLGADGSLALCREIRTPGFVVPVVDPTGAGDAFRGGFIAGWLRYGPEAGIETLLEYANAVAACNCRALGAQGGLPTRAELDRFVTGAAVARSK